MSRGDPVAMASGIYFQNWHTLYCKGYNSAATENVPDGFTKPGVIAGNFRVNYGVGYDKWRCVQIESTPAGGSNDFTGPKSWPASVPAAQIAKLGLLVIASVYNTALPVGPQLTPWITLYNASESQSASFPFADLGFVNGVTGAWSLDEQVLSIDFGALAFVPDHCQIFFRFGGLGGHTYRLGGYALFWHPSGADASTPYHAFGINPETRSVMFGKSDVGRFEDTAWAQSRYLDVSGGAEPHVFEGRFSQMNDADLNVLSKLWSLNRGRFGTDKPGGLNQDVRFVCAQPLVIQPHIDSVDFTGATRTRPLFMYANMVKEPHVIPADAYLSGYWEGAISLREML